MKTQENAKYRTPEIAKIGKASRLTGSTRGGNRYDSKCHLRWSKPLGNGEAE